MTNKEKYKQAFSAVHVSDDFILEAKIMNKTEKHSLRKPITAMIAACVSLVVIASTAYAADVGGIQRIIQLWRYGDQTTATITFDEGHYDLVYSDEEGNPQHTGGGGVAFDADGTQRPLTEEEGMEQLTQPEVSYEADGSVWLYWYNQELEITDKFENGACFVKLQHGEKCLYVTVKYGNGFATSPVKYLMPDEFN